MPTAMPICRVLSISVAVIISTACQVSPAPVVLEEYDCRIDPALYGPVAVPIAPPADQPRTTADAYEDAKRAFIELERVNADHQRIKEQMEARGCL